MSPFNLSSASSQVRTSHYLQPLSKTDTQTSNFARSGGGRLRDSLRRIPSSLSARSKRELEGDAPRKRKQSKASKEALSVISDTSRDSSLQKAQDLPISPSITTAQSQPAGKTKSKTKTRRVLAEIISWGNSFHSSSKSTAPITKISAPQPLRSSVAKLPIQTPAAAQTASLAVDSEPLRAAIDPRVPVKITKVLVKKPSSRQIHSNSSRSGLSSTSSTQSAMENLRRPSMGPDPFRRHDQGAELVEHVIRHGVKRVPPKSTERKESFSSKDALSRMSPESDDLSTADVASK